MAALLAATSRPAAPRSRRCSTATEDLTDDEIKRYSRHLILEDVGVEGQKRLKASKVAVVGAGGLGSPALLYLAAAGVGTLTIVDDDTVETSNLQRQIVHDTEEVGEYKARLGSIIHQARQPPGRSEATAGTLNKENAQDLLKGHDVDLGRLRQLRHKYAVDDACRALGIPCAYAAILRFEGQASTFNYPPGVGPYL